MLFLPFRFLALAGISCARTRSYLGLDTAMYEVPGIVFVVVACILYERVACFVLWNWIDVNMMDTIIVFM